MSTSAETQGSIRMAAESSPAPRRARCAVARELDATGWEPRSSTPATPTALQRLRRSPTAQPSRATSPHVVQRNALANPRSAERPARLAASTTAAGSDPSPQPKLAALRDPRRAGRVYDPTSVGPSILSSADPAITPRQRARSSTSPRKTRGREFTRAGGGLRQRKGRLDHLSADSPRAFANLRVMVRPGELRNDSTQAAFPGEEISGPAGAGGRRSRACSALSRPASPAPGSAQSMCSRGGGV